MVARLGKVVFWACCLISTMLLGLAAYFGYLAMQETSATWAYDHAVEFGIKNCIFAVLVFLTGLATRYVLTPK